MTDDTDTQPAALPGAAAPWYQSAVQKAQVSTAVAALVALSPKLGNLIGVHSSVEAAAWVETVAGIYAVASPLVGILWRARSKLQPLTLTRARAEVHPATIAAIAKADAVPLVPQPPEIPR
jgi:hypothetical protein